MWNYLLTYKQSYTSSIDIQTTIRNYLLTYIQSYTSNIDIQTTIRDDDLLLFLLLFCCCYCCCYLLFDIDNSNMHNQNPATNRSVNGYILLHYFRSAHVLKPNVCFFISRTVRLQSFLSDV